MSFHQQVAIVTGAGQGIGRQIAARLAAEGARVILNDLDETIARQAAEAIGSSTGAACLAVPGDASRLDVIGTMVDSAIEAFGRIDVAIANAGITLYGDFFTYPPESFYRVLEVNLGGSFFLAREVARRMKSQPSGGSILFTSSVTGHQAHKNLAAYGMTKAALEMLARNLVIELSPYRINVNAIAPGATVTDRTLLDKDYEETWSMITPMGRPATVDDIANAALFLVDEKSRHITGQSLVVDGGWTSVSPSPYR